MDRNTVEFATATTSALADAFKQGQRVPPKGEEGSRPSSLDFRRSLRVLAVLARTFDRMKPWLPSLDPAFGERTDLIGRLI